MSGPVVGKRIPKVDSREKVTGKAIYAGDMRMPGMLYGKIVRCWEHAHARVKKIDFTDALKVPGVVKCVGPDDVTKKPYNTTIMKLLVPEIFGEVFGEIADLNIFNRVVKHQGDAVCGVAPRRALRARTSMRDTTRSAGGSRRVRSQRNNAPRAARSDTACTKAR